MNTFHFPLQGLLLLYHLQSLFCMSITYVCVSLIWLWAPRLEELCLSSSPLPSFLFILSMFSFLPLFLYSFLTQFFILLLFICLFLWQFLFYFNVSEPESRIIVDQLQRHPRYAVLNCRKEKVTKYALNILQNIFRYTKEDSYNYFLKKKPKKVIWCWNIFLVICSTPSH